MEGRQNQAGGRTVYDVKELQRFGAEVLQESGLPADRAATVSEILVEGDLLGHTTHGLKLLAGYVGEIENGRMSLQGDPEVVADHGSALTLDGRYLPGPWLVVRALNTAFDRIGSHPVVTTVIRRSHHIACLAAYLKRATDRQLFCILTCSDPNFQSVAPFGGTTPVYSPNPLAAGIPTAGDPILFDVSVSNTANGPVARHHALKERLPGPWLIDGRGVPTDDPAVMYTEPPGTILPLGGMDLGYKGFSLGILVEALTSALGGFGRADQASQWGASVFLQVIDPRAFGGIGAFVRETSFFADACRRSERIDGGRPIRLPGERALGLRERQLRDGLELAPDIPPLLRELSEKYGLPMPAPLQG